MKDSQLVLRAKQIYKQLDLGKFTRERKANALIDSHQTVTYPPLAALHDITQEQIFSEKEKPKKREVTFYAHLPFCTGKCIYCHYFSIANPAQKLVESYLDSLKKEVSLLLSIPQFQRMNASQLYFGGGTPTYLTAEQLEDLCGFFKEKLKIPNKAEWTVEANPETIVGKEGEKKLQTLIGAGVNRLSIGVQIFDDEILSFVGRGHDKAIAIKAIEAARQAGFERIAVDLILGLPKQSLRSFEADLRVLKRIMPESVSPYPLRILPNSKILGLFQSNPELFPNKKDFLLMYIMAIEKFSEMGYLHNPNTWFVKNKKYFYQQELHKWQKMGESVSFGVGVYGYVNNFQYYNHKSLDNYLRLLENNRLPVWKGKLLSTEEQMRRKIIFNLKTTDGIDKASFERCFGTNPEELFAEKFEELEKRGLLENNSERIKLTYRGSLFEDEICQEFFSEEVKTAAESGKKQ